MSNDISKVYQFLSTIGDWKTKADKNADGTIIKSEFRIFMEDNYEWDGGTTDAGKNDLINSFWKAIDTNQSGKISGTRYKNKNALDSTEQEAIQNKIEVYTELETYRTTVLNKAPGNVDAQQWKKSVAEALLTNTDAFIAQGGKADGLKAYLDAQINYILNRTTANETAKYSLQQQVPNYNEGNLDNTLNSIISQYIEEHINKLGADEIENLDMSAVQAEIKKIVDAYVAVSNPDTCTDEAIDTLKDYGYDVKSNTALTDLQKYKLKTQLTTVLADLKNEADYKTNSALYDKAIEKYIDSVLSGASFEDYRTKAVDNKISIEAFKSSEAGKALTKTITVKNMFGGDDLKTALTNKLSEAIANQLSGAMTGAFPAYDEIKTQALEKAQNGDFDDADGNLDINKAIEWVVEQVNNKLTDIFSSNMDKLELADLATIYDKSANVAKENDDIAGLRKAAISYCDSVAKRSTKLAEAVKEIFGNTYSTEINKMSNVDIEAKMVELKAKVEEIGDISKMTDAEKNALTAGIKDSYTVIQNSTNNTVQVPTTGYCNGKLITSDRFNYKVSGCLTKDSNGNISVDASKAGTFTGTISIIIDGKEVAKKTVTITVSTKQDFMNKMQEDKNTKINGKSIAEIMLNGNNRIKLSGFHRNGGNSLNDTKSAAKTALKSELNNIVKILESAGYATGMLQKAVTTTYNYYIAAIDSLTDQVNGKKGVYDRETSFTYTDADGTSHTEKNKYRQQTYKYESSAGGTDYEGNDVSTTGLFLGESYNKTNTYCIYLNTRTLLNRLMSFI